MHAFNDPPGHPEGEGEGDGATDVVLVVKGGKQSVHHLPSQSAHWAADALQ